MTQTEKIALRLAEVREEAGKTQADAAAFLGKTYQAISNWERGHTKIDSVSLLKLLTFYHADIYDFMESCDFVVLRRADGSDAFMSNDTREVAEAYSSLDTIKEKNMVRKMLGLPGLDDEAHENEALSRGVG